MLWSVAGSAHAGAFGPEGGQGHPTIAVDNMGIFHLVGGFARRQVEDHVPEFDTEGEGAGDLVEGGAAVDGGGRAWGWRGSRMGTSGSTHSVTDMSLRLALALLPLAGCSADPLIGGEAMGRPCRRRSVASWPDRSDRDRRQVVPSVILRRSVGVDFVEFARRDVLTGGRGIHISIRGGDLFPNNGFDGIWPTGGWDLRTAMLRRRRGVRPPN